MHEQLRLERTARDVGLSQIKEQISREMQARQSYVEHYEEVLLKERAGRSALEQAVEERFKIVENAMNLRGVSNHDFLRDRETREHTEEFETIEKRHTGGPIRNKGDIRSGSMSPRCMTPGPMKRTEFNERGSLGMSQSSSELGVHRHMVMSPRCRTPGLPGGPSFLKTVGVSQVPTPSTTSSAPSGHPSHQPPPSISAPPPIGTLSSSGLITPRVLAPGSGKPSPMGGSASHTSLPASGAMSPLANVQRMFSYGSSSVTLPCQTPRQAHKSPTTAPQRQQPHDVRMSHKPA